MAEDHYVQKFETLQLHAGCVLEEIQKSLSLSFIL